MNRTKSKESEGLRDPGFNIRTSTPQGHPDSGMPPRRPLVPSDGHRFALSSPLVSRG
jgi:hypothetical protein